MEHGELLRDDGTVEMHNIDFHSHAVRDYSLQRDIFYLSGDGTMESFTPRFHYNGFQYVTVTADRPVELDRSSLTAHFLHTDVPSVGDFRSSNELLKQPVAGGSPFVPVQPAGHTYRLPAPREERLDGRRPREHRHRSYQLRRHHRIREVDRRHGGQPARQRLDIGYHRVRGGGYDDWIGPVWDAAMFIIPDALYNYYGDARAIEDIPRGGRYLQYLAARENEGEGAVTYGLGDWCFYKTRTPSDFTTTCFYYYDQKLMARFAAP